LVIFRKLRILWWIEKCEVVRKKLNCPNYNEDENIGNMFFQK